MANERQRRLMQEALDESLEQSVRQQLLRDLDSDPEQAAEYNRLRQVDRVLRSAPFEHAPRTLALSIMARLAEGLKQPQLSYISGLALALALTLVTIVMIPLLVGASLLFLNAVGSAAALAALLETVARLLTLVVASAQTMVNGAQSWLEDYPQTPALMLTLIPVLLFWMARLNVFKRPSGSDQDSKPEP